MIDWSGSHACGTVIDAARHEQSESEIEENLYLVELESVISG
jgi:hypothetical protein